MFNERDLWLCILHATLPHQGFALGIAALKALLKAEILITCDFDRFVCHAYRSRTRRVGNQSPRTRILQRRRVATVLSISLSYFAIGTTGYFDRVAQHDRRGFQISENAAGVIIAMQ